MSCHRCAWSSLLLSCLTAFCRQASTAALPTVPPLLPLLPQIDLVQGMMDCLYAQCTPCITDCVMAELEKLGQKYRVALKIAKVGGRGSRGGRRWGWGGGERGMK